MSRYHGFDTRLNTKKATTMASRQNSAAMTGVPMRTVSNASY